jgi:hypothetical protein
VAVVARALGLDILAGAPSDGSTQRLVLVRFSLQSHFSYKHIDENDILQLIHFVDLADF